MAKNIDDMQALAQQVAQRGRYGDDILVHMNRYELEDLNNRLGGTMTVNPDTGQPEAFLPFLAGLFGGLGAAGTAAAAAAPAIAGIGAAAAPAAAGLGAAGAAGLGAAGLGAAGLGAAAAPAAAGLGAAALPAAAAGSLPAAGLGAAALPATAAAAPLSGAAATLPGALAAPGAASTIPGAIGTAAPAAAAAAPIAPTAAAAAPAALPGSLAGAAPAIPSAEIAAASTQAGIPGSLAGAAPGAQMASAAPGGLPGAMEAGKIGARLPGMIPPSATPTPLPTTSVPTTPMQGGFGGTMVPEIGTPSAPMSAPVPSPSAMFDPMAAEAIQPTLGAPKGPTGLSLVDPGIATTEGPLGPLGQAGIDVTKSMNFPGGPLPQPAGPMSPASRVAGAFNQPFPAPANVPGPTGPMPADATITMAQVTPTTVSPTTVPPIPQATPPLSPVDIPGSAVSAGPAPGPAPGPAMDTAAIGTSEVVPPTEPLAYAEPVGGSPALEGAAAAEGTAAEEGFLGGIGLNAKTLIPGAMLASALMPGGGGGGPDDEEDEETELTERDPDLDVTQFPGADYRPGIDPEWQYFANRPYTFANGGLVDIPVNISVGTLTTGGGGPSSDPFEDLGTSSGLPGAPVVGAESSLTNNLGPWGLDGVPDNPTPASPVRGNSNNATSEFGGQTFQEGGEVLGQPDARIQLIDAAEKALMGEHPEPDKAIKDFIDAFGESAFDRLQQAIITKMQGGFNAEEPRMVRGPGGPKDDKIPARINGVEEARLSDGEVVIPADAVAGAGGGNVDAGAANLMQMSQRLAGKPPLQQMPVERVPG